MPPSRRKCAFCNKPRIVKDVKKSDCLCSGCRKLTRVKGDPHNPVLSPELTMYLGRMRPENDYRIIDETGREVWASDLRKRYIRETRPIGRMVGGY